MFRSLRTAGAAAALAFLAVVASDTGLAQDVVAHNEGPPNIDFDAFFAAVPQMKELSAETLAQSRELNEAMERLAASEADPAKNKAERAATRDLLVRYRANKVRLVRLVDGALRTPAPKMTDLEILRKLRETDLVGIRWEQRKFIDCLRDISQALDVRFVMHTDVLKFNTVEVSFARSSADAILRGICHGFDCDYYVHEGEIIIIKAIKRNDKRMDRFLQKHPDWKFWRKKEAVLVEDDL